jgi:cell division protease FtsH
VLAFGKSRGKVWEERDVHVSFADVAGVDEAKEELVEIIDFLKSPGKYRAIGARIPKGVLLVGPPGTGKTLLARAVAGEAKVPFISINGSEFVEMFVGVGAARVRDLFVQAEKAAPCIVFIDELDAIGRSRGGAAQGHGGNEEREQTLNQLLVEMDGLEPKRAVIIMSATNRPEVLDLALLRPGRFDRQIVVDRPDLEGRVQILRVHTRGVLLEPDVDIAVVAARTPGFAGADLANLVNEAALLAARRGRGAVSMHEISDAIDRVVAGLQKKSRLITEHERRRVAFHEAGHALASVLAGSEERVHKISIIPRGMAALGFTMQMPTRDRYIVTESELHTKLIGLLGGRAAEEIVFGEASTGAKNDLQNATEIARAMVTEYGMSEAVGLVSVAQDAPLFLPGLAGMPRGGRNVGEHLGDTVDSEVRSIVDAAYRGARALLEENRPALDQLAERLIEVEQLEGEELERLLEEAGERRRKTRASSQPTRDAAE